MLCDTKWWIHVIIYLSKPIECTTPGVNPNVNDGLWAIATGQCKLIGTMCHSGGGCWYRGRLCTWWGGAEGIQELSLYFCSVLL